MLTKTMGKRVRAPVEFGISDELAMRMIASRGNLESRAVGMSQRGSLKELMKKERLV